MAGKKRLLPPECITYRFSLIVTEEGITVAENSNGSGGAVAHINMEQATVLKEGIKTMLKDMNILQPTSMYQYEFGD